MEVCGCNPRVRLRRDSSHSLLVCLLRGVSYVWTSLTAMNFLVNQEDFLLDSRTIATARQRSAKYGMLKSQWSTNRSEDEDLICIRQAGNGQSMSVNSMIYEETRAPCNLLLNVFKELRRPWQHRKRRVSRSNRRRRRSQRGRGLRLCLLECPDESDRSVGRHS